MAAVFEQFAEKQSYKLVTTGHYFDPAGSQEIVSKQESRSEIAIQCCVVEQQEEKHKWSPSSILFSKSQKSRMPAALKLLLESPAIGCKTKKRQNKPSCFTQYDLASQEL